MISKWTNLTKGKTLDYLMFFHHRIVHQMSTYAEHVWRSEYNLRSGFSPFGGLVGAIPLFLASTYVHAFCHSRKASLVVCRPGYSSLSNHKYIPRRAVLYVPGNDEKKIRKIPSLKVDCAVLDCEDGVAANKKNSTTTSSSLHLLQCGDGNVLAIARPFAFNCIRKKPLLDRPWYQCAMSEGLES
ncbi:hypothetical protein STEG23_035523 [Scotinomys teguina]